MKKISRNKKALSPVVAAIILIAVTVAVAIAAAAWLGSMSLSFMSVEEVKITNCQWAQDGSYADLTVNNVGTKSATISKVEVNGVLANDVSIVSGSATVNAGETATIRITQSFSSSTKYEFRIITQAGTGISYIASSGSTSVIPTASIHYVNITSNVDGSSDKGTHSDFADQRVGPDSLFDVLTEGDGGGLTSIIQYVDSSSSNIDVSDDVGTETNFVNAQDYAPDSDYMTIQEYNKGGSTTSEILFIGSDTQSGNNPTSGTFSFAGVSPQAGDFVLCWWYTRSNTKTIAESAAVTQLYDVSSSSYGRLFVGYRIYQNGDSSYSWTSSSVSQATTSYGTLTFHNVNQTNPIDVQSGTPAGWSNAEDPDGPAVNVQTAGACVVTVFGKNNDFVNCNPPTNYLLAGSTDSSAGGDASAGAAYRLMSGTGSEDPPVWALTGGASSDDGYVWTVSLKPTIIVTTDYELDFEYKWTNADYDETTEEVCIYVQTASQGGENLVAYEWDGATWQSLGTLSSDGWNNFTVSHLSGTTYTINIRDEDKSNDATQSTWRIDCIITDCSSTVTNYELDMEIQFTDINVGNDYEEICIFMGSATGEALDVYIWNGGSWDSLATGLTPNQWNNMTYAITEENVTLRLLGTVEISDTTHDSWQIDCALLYAPPYLEFS